MLPPTWLAGWTAEAVATEYKVVELGVVTDEQIEAALNEWTRQGWTFEGMQFAMRDSSPRPAMAFLTFVRAAAEDEGHP